MGFAGGAIGLSCLARLHRHRHLVALLDYARRWPRMHPREYFHAFFAGLGPLPLGLPEPPPCLALPILDFRDGAPPRLRLWPTLHAACSTWFMTQQVLRARRVFGAQAVPELFDGLMAIWGARLLMLGRLRITVEGVERLTRLPGPALLCFNHKSAIDFAVGPAVFTLIDMAHRRPFRIRYLAAKDHFRDNWFLYRGIGIGRAVEAAGMIFVNRRGTPAERRQAIPAAVDQLLDERIDVAIYPQGTRARGNRGPHGERLDAGYFTAGGARRLAVFGGHCKKGAAHLAVAAAERLGAIPGAAPLHVIPVALIGTATALPKGALRVRVGTEIRVVIGTPLPVQASPEADLDTAVTRVHTYIDRQLEQLLGLRGQLTARFLTDIRHLLSQADMETVAELLRRRPDEDRLLYAVLDCIYAAPPSAWQPWLHALAESLAQGEPRERLEELYRTVVAEMR